MFIKIKAKDREIIKFNALFFIVSFRTAYNINPINKVNNNSVKPSTHKKTFSFDKIISSPLVSSLFRLPIIHHLFNAISGYLYKIFYEYFLKLMATVV